MRIKAAYLATLVVSFGTCAMAAESSADKKDPVLIYRNAGVNQDQEAKIRQLAQEYDKQGRVRLGRLQVLSKQMRDLSYDAELDESKLLSLQNELNEVQSAINTERTKLMVKIRGILTPEQKQKLVDLMREKDGLPPLKASEKPAENAGAAESHAANPAPSPTPVP